jgi:hypothetical protein
MGHSGRQQVLPPTLVHGRLHGASRLSSGLHSIICAYLKVTVVRTQIQLTERQAELIRQVAAIRRVSMAEAIRQRIDQFLRETT